MPRATVKGEKILIITIIITNLRHFYRWHINNKVHSLHRTQNSVALTFQHDGVHNTIVLLDGNKLNQRVTPCKCYKWSMTDANIHLFQNEMHLLLCHLTSWRHCTAKIKKEKKENWNIGNRKKSQAYKKNPLTMPILNCK